MKYSNMKELKEILTQNKFIKEPYEATFNFDEKFNEVTIQILLGDEVKYEKSCHILGVSALIKNITDEGYPILIKKVKYYDSTLPLEKIGKIQLGEEVILTDPCYTPNESRNNKIKVKPGTWNVSYAQLGIYSTRPEYLILSHESYTETPKRLTKLPFTIGVDSGQLGVTNVSEYENIYSGDSEAWYDFICEKTYRHVKKELPPGYKKLTRKYKAVDILFSKLIAMQDKELLSSIDKLRKQIKEMELELRDFYPNIPYYTHLFNDKNNYLDLSFEPYVTHNAVWSSTAYGDGIYQATVKRNKNKEIVYIKIDMK
jgi:hypothetical protein